MPSLRCKFGHKVVTLAWPQLVDSFAITEITPGGHGVNFRWLLTPPFLSSNVIGMSVTQLSETDRCCFCDYDPPTQRENPWDPIEQSHHPAYECLTFKRSRFTPPGKFFAWVYILTFCVSASADNLWSVFVCWWTFVRHQFGLGE